MLLGISIGNSDIGLGLWDGKQWLAHWRIRTVREQMPDEYAILLREYREPPPEPVAPPSQDTTARAWAEQTAEETAASINQIVGSVLDEDGNPRAGLRVKIAGEEVELQGTTDDRGIYRQEDLKPGTYEVTVEEPGYEGIKRKVEIPGSPSGGSGRGTGSGP